MDSSHDIECDRASNASTTPNIVLRHNLRFYIAPVGDNAVNALIEPHTCARLIINQRTEEKEAKVLTKETTQLKVLL
ncbi:hypothetical protein K0M31_012936 [Melipona bicolor]|uniref:Uncharacterized protein n=1 Tax=Melipona bicolor TaxID=60889 RepID=A0AA40KGS6_9HYME|nr:hypothetical protein K0M31_012936 [Melipona bicolor]